MSNRRKHLRTPVTTSVKLIHPETGASILCTRDISHGGLFLLRGNGSLPRVGEEVQVQAQDMPVEAPIVAMRVIREEPEGIALEFLEPDD